MKMDHYIEESQLSFWLSVPSTGVALDRLKKLIPGRFPSFRVILFCGEPLPSDLASKWALAAPQAKIVNIYGPTEATIAFTHFEWHQSDSNSAAETVPIGWPLPGLKTKVVPESGELLLGGPQVVDGYLNSPEQTEAKFVTLTGESGLWYKTGDLVTEKVSGCLHFKGRVDDQWQVRGQRIERLELENNFRKALGFNELLLIPSPITEAGLVMGVALVYLQQEERSEIELRKLSNQHFSAPFLPTAYIALEDFPRNLSGKVDYKKICQNYQRKEQG